MEGRTEGRKEGRKCTNFGENPLKDVNSRVFTRMLQGKNTLESTSFNGF
jgi:hypothetical protein